MYPRPEEVVRHAAERPNMPLILCEYSHAMGNSNGGLKEYWDIFYSGTNAQGAFVWDWVDQGIREPVPGEYKANSAKPTFLAYGGWWEDKTGIRNDNDFNNNGLVAGDRTPTRACLPSSTSIAICTSTGGSGGGADQSEELVLLHLPRTSPKGPGR